MTTFIKTKLKKSDDQTNIEKYRVAANIIISKSIFFRIIIPKFMMIRQLFYVQNVCKNVKNQHLKKRCTDCLFTIRESYASYILHNCIMNHHTEFEIDKTILTCLN